MINLTVLCYHCGTSVFLKPQIQSCFVLVLCTLIETAKVHHQTRPGSVSEVKPVQQASSSIGESIQSIDIESGVPGETAELSPTLLNNDSAMLQTTRTSYQHRRTM